VPSEGILRTATWMRAWPSNVLAKQISNTGKDAVKIAPSILAADFARLGIQVGEAERAGADRIHVDVMDGHFVPNISMGAPIVASLRPITQLPLETHLMISDPDLFIEEFIEAGSDSFIVHWEGNNNLNRTVQSIRRHASVSAWRSIPRRQQLCWKKFCMISIWYW
jgi:pentose-5-phosphate-3-epimerase